MRTFLNAEGKQSQEWVLLNFNERSPDGQYVLERFPKAYGFDLDHKIPSWIQFHESMGHDQMQRITSGLQKGNREPIHLPVEGKDRTFYAEVNLQDKTLHYYDEKQQPIKGDIAAHFRGQQQRVNNRIQIRKGPRERTVQNEGTAQSVRQ